MPPVARAHGAHQCAKKSISTALPRKSSRDRASVFVKLSGEAAGGTRASAGFVYHDANDGGTNLLFRNDISPRDGSSARGGIG